MLKIFCYIQYSIAKRNAEPTYERVPLGTVNNSTDEALRFGFARLAHPHGGVIFGIDGGQVAKDVVVWSGVFLSIVHVQSCE